MSHPATLLTPVYAFLRTRTLQSWIDEARKPENLPLLLSDHLACELKAAQTASWLIRKYAADKPSGDAILAWLRPYEALVYHQDNGCDFISAHRNFKRHISVRNTLPWADALVEKMVILIKEELHHFYQVWEIMCARGIAWQKITASRYAKGLMRDVTTYEPDTLVDKLICGAYIEARSCERFASLAPWLDKELGNFYLSLLRSEARHYRDYLALAQQISPVDITSRITQIGITEARLITEPDTMLRFHSGAPIHMAD